MGAETCGMIGLLVASSPLAKQWEAGFAGGGTLASRLVSETAHRSLLLVFFFTVASWALWPNSHRVGALATAWTRKAQLAGTLALFSLGGCAPAPSPLEVVEFWRGAGPRMWFAKDAEFDRRFRERFLGLHEAAVRGELDAWRESPEGVLALCLLLDQFPRNAFRGTPRMYATDKLAREVADRAIRASLDHKLEPEQRLFVYLPFGHSEALEDQERSVQLAESLGEPSLSHARQHRDIVKRFGRFPHRNQILGRAMRPEEQKYLDEGGYQG